jgi:hypothetical protein
VIDTGGFAGAVTLAVSGLPSGVTALFGINPATGSSVLTFTVGAAAPAGTTTVSVFGTSGALTPANTTITLTVTAKTTQGFTLAPARPSLSIVPGGSATDTISVTDEGGFAGNVNLSASGLPSGVTASFGTNPTSGSSILTLTASATAATGTSTVTISGTSGSVSASTSIVLTVSPANNGGIACHVVYTISSHWQSGFGAAIAIENTGTAAIGAWTLTWSFANGQTITQIWNGSETQSGANVTVNSLTYNGSIPAGGSYSGMGFNGTWNNVLNTVPSNFAVNGTACN